MKEQMKRQLQMVRAHLDNIPVSGESVIRLGFAMQTLDKVVLDVDKLQEPEDGETDG